MADTPYPLTRQTREHAMINGNGGATYGPFAFKIFDTADVEVLTKAAGATKFSIALVTVTKVSGLPLDNFSIAFPANVPATTKIKVLGKRLPERSAGIAKGTRLDMDALEKELSKIAAAQQELRRDVIPMDPEIDNGSTLMLSDGRVIKGPNASEILAALTYANAAYNSASAAASSASQAAASATAAALFNPANYYLKTEIDAGFYTKTAIDSGFYTKAAVDTALALKASLTGAETLTNKTLTSPVLNTPSLILKQSASPTPTAEGDAQWDSSKDRFVVGNSAGGQASFAPNDWEKIGLYSPSSVATLAITNLGAYKFLRLVGSFTCNGTAAALQFRVSADNGATWLQGATDYAHMYTGEANGVTASSAVNLSLGYLSATTFVSGSPRVCSLEFFKFNVSGASKPYFGRCIGLASNSQNAHYMHGGRFFNGTAVALNALQIFPSNGTFSAEFYLEGLK